MPEKWTQTQENVSGIERQRKQEQEHARVSLSRSHTMRALLLQIIPMLPPETSRPIIKSMLNKLNSSSIEAIGEEVGSIGDPAAAGFNRTRGREE